MLCRKRVLSYTDKLIITFEYAESNPLFKYFFLYCIIAWHKLINFIRYIMENDQKQKEITSIKQEQILHKPRIHR